MKNYEKYADEIREYEGNNFCKDFIEPYILKSNACNPDDCGLCNMLQYIWLLQDYKEPEEPEVDWSKVAVYTPILVRQGKSGRWFERHFAKYEDGRVFVWNNGKTSWTAPDDELMTDWNYAKLAEGEEE